MGKSEGILVLFFLSIILSSAYAGCCYIPGDSCCGTPCEVFCNDLSCRGVTYKSTSTAFDGCYPLPKWTSNGQYLYDFGGKYVNDYTNLKLTALAIPGQVDNDYRLANDYVVVKIKLPNGNWRNVCNLTSCIGGNINQGINSGNTWSFTSAFDGIPALVSWANSSSNGGSSYINVPLDQNGNYKLRVYVLGTASGNRAKIQTQLSKGATSSSHSFYASSNDAGWASNEYYLAKNAACSDQAKWINIWGCQDIDTLDEFDYMEYNWCKSGQEVCDGRDNDCDGLVDEGVKTTFFKDLDGDTYGNLSITTQACTAPIGFSLNNADCNDSNSQINPSATEVCDGVDNDCDTQIDEGLIDCPFNKSYSCIEEMDTNSIPCEGATENLVKDIKWTLIDSNSFCDISPKCSSYCKDGYKKEGNLCVKKAPSKEGTKNTIIDFKTNILEGKVFVNASCLYDLIEGEQTIIEVELFKNGEKVELDQNSFDCTSEGSFFEINSLIDFEQNVQYSLKGKINSVCEVCEREVFFYYVLSQKESAIPDANILSIFAFLGIMLFLMYKKRI